MKVKIYKNGRVRSALNWNKTLKTEGFILKLRDKGMCKLQKIQFSVVAEYQYLCKSNKKY